MDFLRTGLIAIHVTTHADKRALIRPKIEPHSSVLVWAILWSEAIKGGMDMPQQESHAPTER
jgi:hypothetical protein